MDAVHVYLAANTSHMYSSDSSVNVPENPRAGAVQRTLSPCLSDAATSQAVLPFWYTQLTIQKCGGSDTGRPNVCSSGLNEIDKYPMEEFYDFLRKW
ncbi:hypothetical protein PHMEG_00013742 [Phytophthora megakarya]|uniref:Uncharacterized protein n=1 Tax=Phytophthora megakarya TaxID=4795 RepID=A0A225W6K2_9STRA|nr:hypothetical protein PHMEG_00013742 [Phytophthora megakarya]